MWCFDSNVPFPSQVKDLALEEVKYKRLEQFEGVYDWLPYPGSMRRWTSLAARNHNR